MEPNDKDFRVIFSGLGGHGGLTFGQFLAKAAATRYRHVTLFPYYASQMRGGDSEATVTASNEEIDSPIAYEIEMAIVTSPTMFRVIEKRVKPGGVMLVDSSIITDTADREDIATYYIPASRIATERIGVPLASNLVLMGAYLEATRIIPYDVVEEAITNSLTGTTKEQYLNVNIRALSEGRQFIRDSMV